MLEAHNFQSERWRQPIIEEVAVLGCMADDLNKQAHDVYRQGRSERKGPPLKVTCDGEGRYWKAIIH